MKKELQFMHAGKFYRVDEQGRIFANDRGYFSDDWIFMGGSKHHMQNYITCTRSEAFKHPEKLNGCIGWDVDYGTTRRWSGRYNGKLPRITEARVCTSIDD